MPAPRPPERLPGPAAPLSPLGLYVHLPWCVRKCPYCDFNSHRAPDGLAAAEARYVAALLADLEADVPLAGGRPVATVFIGGGTPSLFSGDAIARLLAGIAARVPLAAGCEVTLEANPGAADAARFRAYRAAGVTRLSVGVQSFADTSLAAIGRVHGAAQARRAVAGAREAGFAEVNVDLMFGLPGQSVRAAERDVAAAIDAGASHVSYYELTLEPGTPFGRRPPSLPAEAELEAIHSRGVARLEGAGYRRYEVSAFAPASSRCRHNVNYWRYGDYLGIGAGAHGKLTEAGAGRVWRSVKARHPARYLARAGAGGGVARRAPVAAEDLPGEFMMNALRLRDGFTESLFEARTGLAFATVRPALEWGVGQGLAARDGRRWRSTGRGLRYLNELLVRFLA